MKGNFDMDLATLAQSCKNRAIGLIKKNCLKNRRKLPDGLGPLESVGSIRGYVCCVKLYLFWCNFNHVPSNVESSKTTLIDYLRKKSEIYCQKTLNQHRMALQRAYFKKLPFLKSSIETIIASRDYSLSDIQVVIERIELKNAIGILLCYFAGLRAHELITLHRFDEGSPTQTCKWTDKLFLFEENFTPYLTVGKGGLCRQVAIPNQLVPILESFRLSCPRQVRDREINYLQRYDVGFGHPLSHCFSRASKKFLGYSKGLHGLRHSYVKNRIKKLTDNGIDLEMAKAIVSQEIGHFRVGIINTYLR